MISEVFNELVESNLRQLNSVASQDYVLEVVGDQYQVLSGNSSITEFMPLSKIWDWLSGQFDVYYNPKRSGRIGKRVS